MIRKNKDWHIEASAEYLGAHSGVTVANGMIGIISSEVPFQVKDVILNGVYDTYGRGRVSNILKAFNPFQF